MADAYVLSESDVRTLRRIAQRERGDPINHRPPIQSPSHPSRIPTVRLGVAYGNIPAAEYDGQGQLTKAGRGEAKFHRLKSDGSAVVDRDDADPTTVLNIQAAELPDKSELLFVRDQTLEGDDPNVPAKGYIAVPLWQPPSKLYLCKDGVQSIADSDDEQLVTFEHAVNYDPGAFEFVPAGQTVTFKRKGVYELRYDFDVRTGEGADAALRRDEVLIRWHGNVGQTTDIVGCSTSAWSILASDVHVEIGSPGGRTWHVRHSEDSDRSLSLRAKRVEFSNGIDIVAGTVAITYLGPLPAAV